MRARTLAAQHCREEAPVRTHILPDPWPVFLQALPAGAPAGTPAGTLAGIPSGCSRVHIAQGAGWPKVRDDEEEDEEEEGCGQCG